MTLGCKVNQYETQALREAWTGAGFIETPEPGGAEIIVIHTCAVTANAVADTRAMARRMHRAAPSAAIYLMGCAAECSAEELNALPGVAGVVRRKDKAAFIIHGPDHFSLETPHDPIGVQEGSKEPCWPPGGRPPRNGKIRKPRFSDFSLSSPPGGRGERYAIKGVPLLQKLFPPLAISDYTRARAVVKVQDGCSHGCTYCIVPLTRGRAASRPPEDILAEMARLHGAGFQELILSGINLRQYGRDFPRSAPIRDFWTLLAWLEERLAPDWAGSARWRLSSLEPGQLGEAALAALSGSRMVTPHLHISLQSGSPSVLKRMGRGHYDPATLPGFLESLRRAWPVMGLGADILMGFPGESEAEFEETRIFVQYLPLTYAHVFPFSPRPGTSAAAMPGHLPRELAEERAAVIRDIVSVKKEEFLRFLLERPKNGLRMVLESRDTGLGVSEYYASCRLSEADIPADAKAGALLDVRPAGVENGLLAVALQKK